MKKKPAALKGLFRKSNNSYLLGFHLLYSNLCSHLRGESSIMSMNMIVHDTPGSKRKSSPWWQDQWEINDGDHDGVCGANVLSL